MTSRINPKRNRVRRPADVGLKLGKTDSEPTLEQMLSTFDPKRHGGELMADAPVGLEAIR